MQMNDVKTIKISSALHNRLKHAAIDSGLSLQIFIERLLGSTTSGQNTIKRALLTELDDDLSRDTPGNLDLDWPEVKIRRIRKADRTGK